jgi:hypothetical protein
MLRFLNRDVEDFDAKELSSSYREGAIRLLAGCAPCNLSHLIAVAGEISCPRTSVRRC